MEREGISHRLYGLKFGVYSAKEIKKLSMREIVNPDSFDAFSHSTPGGLYDTALGPSDLFDVCPTCNLKAMHCPGHMGHIVLPLPVFNPVFFKFFFKILQRMCFECHRFRCHGAVKLRLKTQMELLDKGYLSASERFKQMFSEITQMFPAYEKEEMCLAMEKKILKAAEECLNNEEPPLKQQPVKNVLALKQALFKQFFSQAGFCKLRCPNCKTKPRKLRAEMDSKSLLLQRPQAEGSREDGFSEEKVATSKKDT